VDMPGYGYAKVSKIERNRLGNLIETYVKSRPVEVLRLICILIDSRIGIGEKDNHLLETMDKLKRPYLF